MTGERTPITAPSRGGHTSDDDISLREHIQRQLDINRDSADRATHEQRVLFEAILTERDRRYEQRFIAQELAVSLALARVDKEFHEHIQSVRTETQAALDAADKAIQKSETATEKRFENVNEFRGQLQDQATRFMPRIEAEQRVGQNTEKLATMEARHNDDIRQINSRLDLTQGKSTGMDKTIGWIFAAAGFIGTLIAIFAYVSKK